MFTYKSVVCLHFEFQHVKIETFCRITVLYEGAEGPHKIIQREPAKICKCQYDISTYK